LDRLTYPNPGGRTHFHLRANWPRSQLPERPVSANSSHRDPPRIAAFRSRRECAVRPSRYHRRPSRKGLGRRRRRRRRSRADDPILGHRRTPHLILNNGRATLRCELPYCSVFSIPEIGPRPKKREKKRNNGVFFCFPLGRCHADALLGREGSSQRRTRREAGSLSYRS
jgi:hypothetical protein